MPLKKQNWDVVAFGRWNPGILTPRGIVDRLFEHRQPEAEYEVEFPDDAVGPCRVNYDGLAISVTDSFLAVHPKGPTYTDLYRANGVVKKAMESLPETPVSGVAFNLRFAGDIDASLVPLGDSLRHSWESRFASGGYEIINRSVSFSVVWDGGTILVTLGNKPDIGYRITVSFRQSGPREEMLRWLTIGPDALRGQVSAIFQNVFQIDDKVAQ
jgi:hypothetical protein